MFKITYLDPFYVPENHSFVDYTKLKQIQARYRAAARRLCCCRVLQQTAGSAHLLLLFAAANSLPKPVNSAVRLLLQSSAMADRYD